MRNRYRVDVVMPNWVGTVVDNKDNEVQAECASVAQADLICKKLNRLDALEVTCKGLAMIGLWPCPEEDKREATEDGERGFQAAAKESDRRLREKLSAVLEVDKQ